MTFTTSSNLMAAVAGLVVLLRISAGSRSMVDPSMESLESAPQESCADNRLQQDDATRGMQVLNEEASLLQHVVTQTRGEASEGIGVRRGQDKVLASHASGQASKASDSQKYQAQQKERLA